MQAGYAVIFLHRTHSLRPFSRHYSHSMNPFLDLLTVNNGDQIDVVPGQASKLLPILKAYHQAHDEGSILSVNFQTVNDYLWLLRAVAGVMAPLGRKCMYYLAAAVSDFFLPDDRVVSREKNRGRPRGQYARLWATPTPGSQPDRETESLGCRQRRSGNRGRVQWSGTLRVHWCQIVAAVTLPHMSSVRAL